MASKDVRKPSDAGEAEAWARCFTPDGTFSGPAGEASGNRQLVEFCERVSRALAGSLHLEFKKCGRENGGGPGQRIRSSASRHEIAPAAAHAERAALRALQQNDTHKCDNNHKMNDDQYGLHVKTRWFNI